MQPSDRALPSSAQLAEVWFSELSLWNRRFRLTGLPPSQWQDKLIDQVSPMVKIVQDCADSKSPRTIIDVGSGCGTPGLLLADQCPYWSSMLVDYRSTRASFLSSVVQAMQWSHVQVKASNITQVSAFQTPIILVMRAFFDGPKTKKLVEHLLIHPDSKVVRMHHLPPQQDASRDSGWKLEHQVEANGAFFTVWNPLG